MNLAVIEADTVHEMILKNKNGFVFPDLHLSSLPTGAVKDLVDTLGARIASGEYAVGKNMPMEPELVAEHGVSRTVVREAIKVLSGKGLVRTARRYGTHVCDFEDWNLLDPDVVAWHAPDSPMAKRIYDDASRFRLVIEPNAAGLAAQYASSMHRDQILSAAEVLESNDVSNDSRLAASFAFHASILDASDSIMLRQFRGFLHSIIALDSSRGALSAARSGELAHAHSKIANAIGEGNTISAQKWMHKLLLQRSEVDQVEKAEA